MNESDHLEVCRQSVAAQVNVDAVRVSFDWLVPARVGEAITFMLDVKRGTRTSRIRFHITLAKLATDDLQRLHDLLSERPAGYRLAYEITWLLGLAVKQQMPTLGVEDRATRVRELLLFHQ